MSSSKLRAGLQALAKERPFKFHFCLQYLLGEALGRFIHSTGTEMKAPTELHNDGIFRKCVIRSSCLERAYMLSRKDGQARRKEQRTRQDALAGWDDFL